MKLLMFSDLHLRPESEDVCFKVLEDVYKTAHELNVDAVGFLGDFWHLRYQVPVDLLNRVADWVRMMSSNISLMMISGNHDQINPSGDSALDIMSDCGAEIFRLPTRNEYGLWLPYRKDSDVIRELVTSSKVSSDSKVLYGHIPIFGAQMNNLIHDTDGLPADLFSDWNRVFLGHYHKRQTHGSNIQYLGSPWQTRIDEYNQDKGYTLYDTVADSVTFIPRVIGKRYWRLDGKELKSAPIQAGDHVKCVVGPEESKEMTPVYQSIANEAGIDIVFEDKVQKSPEMRFNMSGGATMTEYALQYIEDHEKDEDRKALLLGAYKGIIHDTH